MGNKKSSDHKEKIAARKEKLIKDTEIRTQEERRFETLNIIYQLKENGLTSDFPAVKTLLHKMSEYIHSNEDIDISIPFPEKKKVIKGKLPIFKNEKPMVMLKHID